MKIRNLLIGAILSSLCILIMVLTGCESSPSKQDDVWSLLARGETDQARAFFLGEVGIDGRDEQGRTALHYAAELEDPILAAFFISLGAEVDAQDNLNRTPLAISTELLDEETARILVQSGASIHHPMGARNSPARIGVRQGGAFLASLINPASVQSTDSTGMTVLHIASEEGNPRSVEVILGGPNNLNQRDHLGRTALDIALLRGDSRYHAEVAERLILAGAVSSVPLFNYFAPAVRNSNYNIRSADGMAPLHYIARESYLGYLEFVLEKNADVNIKNASGATPLHEAARSGNLVVMETLLNHGAEVNTQDAKGNSVLHIAIPLESHLAALELFLRRGANPNVRDEHGSSPLHIVIILNRPVELIHTLLMAGADVSIRDLEGKTPLYLAIEKDRISYISLLLAYNSDIFAADHDGITPFEKALLDHNPVLFSMITPESVFKNDSNGNTMLHIAVAAGGNTMVIGYILERNAPIDARNMAGDTSLTLAVRYNNRAAGEMLLARGADVFALNVRGESPLSLTFPPLGRPIEELRHWMLTHDTLRASDGLGNTVLHYAAQWRLDYWIPILVELGSNTEAANATGETPLFMAVRQDSPSTIWALISSRARIGARDTLGNSALHAAVRWQALRSAEALIDLGLDVNSHALNGKTPLHDAIRLGLPAMETLLLRYRANIEARDMDGNTPLMEAVLAGRVDSMELLVHMGADPMTRNFNGDTALHIAAYLDRPEMVNLLLGWGASIHARNALGRTPLQNALSISPAHVRSLLTRDRIQAADDNGSSPLHIAVQERSDPVIIQTILELGARPSAIDSEGKTPLRLALDLELWETSRLLSEGGSDVFIAARDGRSPAEISLQKGGQAIRAVFSGRAIHSNDSSGNTILHYAARHGDSGVIAELLNMGANRYVRNISSESPADIALRWNNRDAAALLN